MLRARAITCAEALRRSDTDPVIAQQMRAAGAQPATVHGLSVTDGWLLRPSLDRENVAGVAEKGFANRMVYVPMAHNMLVPVGFGIAYEAALIEVSKDGTILRHGAMSYGTGYKSDGTFATWESQCDISEQDKNEFVKP